MIWLKTRKRWKFFFLCILFLIFCSRFIVYLNNFLFLWKSVKWNFNRQYKLLPRIYIYIGWTHIYGLRLIKKKKKNANHIVTYRIKKILVGSVLMLLNFIIKFKYFFKHIVSVFFLWIIIILLCWNRMKNLFHISLMGNEFIL